MDFLVSIALVGASVYAYKIGSAGLSGVLFALAVFAAANDIARRRKHAKPKGDADRQQ
jgi:hypothetical protein